MQGACGTQDKGYSLRLAGEEYLEYVAWANVGVGLDAADLEENLTDDMMRRSGLHASSDWAALREIQTLEAQHVRTCTLDLQKPCLDCWHRN
jgi:hypothetical protein